MTLRHTRPIIVLIVILQLAAPVLAVRAAAAMLNSPWTDVAICHAGGPSGPSKQVPPHHHDGGCPVCQFCAAVQHVIPSPAVDVPIPGGVGVMARATERSDLARGPPLTRPRARAPPKIS
jgi:hypothetical protein